MSLERKLLRTLERSGYQPVTVDELAEMFDINRKGRAELEQTVDSLRNAGKIEVSRDGRLQAKRAAGLIRGTVKKIASGAAFLIPHPMQPGDDPLSQDSLAASTEGPGESATRRQPTPPPVSPPKKAEDIFITAEDLGEAHTGDEVLVRLMAGREDDRRRGPAGRLRGRVVEILERATRTFVGNYFEKDDHGWVQVDGTTINDPVFVGDPGAKGVQVGDKVVVEMVRFPSHFRHGEAVLTSVLGPRGQPGVDTLSIIHEFGIPDEFPPEVLAAAREQAEQFDEENLGDRRDLTGETIVTIDPVDARDFDDAISLTQSDDGHWHLGVHIADVAHFVQPGSVLDREAYRRGTSVYLPDRVIPMLPEVISNGLASLQQGRVRFTKSAFMEFTKEGIPIAADFANSAIKVTRRFAYEEVSAFLSPLPPRGRGARGEGRVAPDSTQENRSATTAPHPGPLPKGEREDALEFHQKRSKLPLAVRQLIHRMHELAMILRARRFAVGALELTLPEVKIDIDKEGRVSGAHVAVNDVSHQIIEEFMLAANQAVATAFQDRGIPFLRRVHADPDEMKLRAFGEFVTSLGFKLKKIQSRTDLQRLLELVHERPERHAVNYAFLRSLKQAAYSPEQLGHYALAMENYCHFTSPIRRYPDLTIHRLIDALVRSASPPGLQTTADSIPTDGTTPKSQSPRRRKAKEAANTTSVSKGSDREPDASLVVTAFHCSRTERRAEQAERELVKIKLLTYLAGRVGEEFDAVITGVQEYGFFCQGIEIPAEGLVHSTTLDDDRYDFDAVSHTITARRSGHRYRLGDKVRLIVAHVDVDRRQLDFRLASSRSGKQIKERKESGSDRPAAGSRGRHQPAKRQDQPRRRKRR